MRFIMLLPCPPEPLEKLTAVPNKEIVSAMRKYNEEMTKAGVLVLAEGLHATSKGFRIKVSAGKKIVTDGPFTEAKEVIAGFWIIQVKSTEEALAWAKRCPLVEGGLWKFARSLKMRTFRRSCERKKQKHNRG